MIGEHALFWLGMETNVLTDHRDKLGVAYLLSVTAFANSHIRAGRARQQKIVEETTTPGV